MGVFEQSQVGNMLALWLLALCGATLGEEWRLVWEDNFDFLDLNKWDHEVTAWGGGNFEFQTYTPDPENSYVKDGKLYIKPTLTVNNINPRTGVRFGNDFLDNGVLNLWDLYGRCTMDNNGGCYRTGSYGDIPPIMSARLRTADRFAFKYGRAEIRAKMPVGDWMWPAMWMLPENWAYGGWPASGEIDIIETIGNRDLKFAGTGIDTGTQKMGSTLHWGVDASQNRFYLTGEHKFNYERNFGDYFHDYVLEWDENSIKWFVDGEMIYQVPETPIDRNQVGISTIMVDHGGATTTHGQAGQELLHLTKISTSF